MRDCQALSSASKASLTSSPARRLASLTRSLRPTRRPPSAGRRHSRGILGLAALDLGHRDGGDRGMAGPFGIANRQLGRHRTRELGSSQGGQERLERVTEGIVHGRTLEPAMRHAVVATGILADTVPLPLRILDERLVSRGIALVGEQVAGPLPAEQVVCGIAPRRALIGLIAGEEIQEQAGMIEGPGLARRAPAALEDLAKELFARMPPQEYVLPRRMVIAVAGRDRDALDAEAHHGVEEIGHPIRVLAVEQRAIDGDAKALAARELDGGDGLVVNALLAHGLVVPLPIAVQVNRERQVWGRLVLIDVLREQNRVGAQIYEFLAGDDPFDDLRHLLVNERLAAGGGDHRRAA